eukprot:577723_1
MTTETTKREEELDPLASTTDDVKNIKEESSDSEDNPKPMSMQSSNSRLQRANKSLRDLREQSMSVITSNEMVETLQFKFFMSVLGVIVFLLIILTPIASIIGGMDIVDVFNVHSEDEINSACDGHYNAFVYPTWNTSLQQVGAQIFIVGIVDLCVLLSCGICMLIVCVHRWEDTGEVGLTCFCIGRSIFMIVWIVYAGFIFDANKSLNQYCDIDSNFYHDLDDILAYLVPIYGIEIVKLVLLLCTYCALPFCIIFAF